MGHKIISVNIGNLTPQDIHCFNLLSDRPKDSNTLSPKQKEAIDILCDRFKALTAPIYPQSLNLLIAEELFMLTEHPLLYRETHNKQPIIAQIILERLGQTPDDTSTLTTDYTKMLYDYLFITNKHLYTKEEKQGIDALHQERFKIQGNTQTRTNIKNAIKNRINRIENHLIQETLRCQTNRRSSPFPVFQEHQLKDFFIIAAEEGHTHLMRFIQDYSSYELLTSPFETMTFKNTTTLRTALSTPQSKITLNQQLYVALKNKNYDNCHLFLHYGFTLPELSDQVTERLRVIEGLGYTPDKQGYDSETLDMPDAKILNPLIDNNQLNLLTKFLTTKIHPLYTYAALTHAYNTNNQTVISLFQAHGHTKHYIPPTHTPSNCCTIS